MIPQETIAVPGGSGAKAGSKRSIESVLVNRWARWLVPSLSDLFFIAMMAWLFMGPAGWSGLLVDGDVGWHIRTGEYIIDQGSVPRADLYSFSKPGAPWYAWEWLSDVVDGALFRIAGLKGVVLLAGVTIAIFGTTLIWRILRRKTHLFVALLLALLGVGAASIHFLARPHVFTLAFLSAAMWILEKDRDASKDPALRHEDAPSKRIWLLVPLTILWTNLHGGFLVLIAVLGLAALGSAAETIFFEPGSYKSRNWYSAIRYGALAAACSLGSLVNPYGWGLHQHVIEYLRSDWIRSVIQEFQSPSFRNENMLQFELLMFLGLAAAGSMVRSKRIVEPLWISFFAYQALSSARHVPVFVAIALPVIAGEVSCWWITATSACSKKSFVGIINQMAADSAPGFRRVSAWPFIFVLVLIVIKEPVKWPHDFPKEVFPAEIVHAHEAEILHSRLLTTDQWADYLIYLHPQQKVFVDGRSDFYGPEVGNEYLAVINGAWNWQKLMAKYGFDHVLMPVEQPIVQLLKQDPDWRVLADDGKRILLARSARRVLPTDNSNRNQGSKGYPYQ